MSTKGQAPTALDEAAGSLPASSVYRLALAWEDRARMADLAWEQERDAGWAEKAEAYRLCAKQLRAEAGYENMRQPEENTKLGCAKRHP